MTTKFNPENQTVEITKPWGEVETVSFIEYFSHKFVSEHLHWDGRFKDVLTPSEWKEAYLMCDGFGLIDERTATEDLKWDWSHVRDSQWTTLIEVADFIASLHWTLKDIQELVLQRLLDCHRVELDPVESLV